MSDMNSSQDTEYHYIIEMKSCYNQAQVKDDLEHYTLDHWLPIAAITFIADQVLHSPILKVLRKPLQQQSLILRSYHTSFQVLQNTAI